MREPIPNVLTAVAFVLATACKASPSSSDAAGASPSGIAAKRPPESPHATAASSQVEADSAATLFALLIGTESKVPVPSARIILAPKKEGQRECTIDTSLTGLSNDRGEIRIPKLAPGEYVVFYNLSGSIDPNLNSKVVSYDPVRYGNVNPPEYIEVIRRSLGVPGVTGLTDGKLVVLDGHAIIGGYYYMHAPKLDLGIISVDGMLLTVRMPHAGPDPIRIEIAPFGESGRGTRP